MAKRLRNKSIVPNIVFAIIFCFIAILLFVVAFIILPKLYNEKYDAGNTIRFDSVITAIDNRSKTPVIYVEEDIGCVYLQNGSIINESVLLEAQIGDSISFSVAEENFHFCKENKTYDAVSLQINGENIVTFESMELYNRNIKHSMTLTSTIVGSIFLTISIIFIIDATVRHKRYKTNDSN